MWFPTKKKSKIFIFFYLYLLINTNISPLLKQHDIKYLFQFYIQVKLNQVYYTLYSYAIQINLYSPLLLQYLSNYIKYKLQQINMNSTNSSDMYCSKHTQNGKKCIITHILISQRPKNPLFCQQCVKVFLAKGGKESQILTKDIFTKKYFVQVLKMYQKVGPNHQQTLRNKQKYLLDSLKAQFQQVKKAFAQIQKFVRFSLNTLAQPFSEQQVRDFYHGKINAQKVQDAKKKIKVIKNFQGLLQGENQQNLNMMIQCWNQQLKTMTEYNKNKSAQIKKKMIEFMKNVGKKEKIYKSNQSESSFTELNSGFSNIKIEHIQDQGQKLGNIIQEESMTMMKKSNCPSLFQNQDIPKLPKKRITQEYISRIEEQNHKNDHKIRQKTETIKGFQRQSQNKAKKTTNIKMRINRPHMQNKRKQDQMSEQSDSQQQLHQKNLKSAYPNKQKKIQKKPKQLLVNNNRIKSIKRRGRINILRKLMIQGQVCYEFEYITKGLGNDIYQIKIRTEKEMLKNHSELIQAYMRSQIQK